MALQAMISGADCTVITNPLHQVLKHTESDHSLQKDRIAGPSSSRLQYLPSTTSVPLNPADVQMARQFFEARQSQLQGPLMSRSGLPAIPPVEFERFQIPDVRPDQFAPLWAEYEAKFQTSSFHPQNWSGEFGFQSPATQIQPQSLGLAQQNGFGNSAYRHYTTPYGASPYQMLAPTMPSTADVKGKGRELSAADFEAAFASFDQELSSRIIEVADDVTSLEDAFAKQTLEEGENSVKDRGEGREGDEATRFQQVWEQLQNSDMPPPEEDMARWEAEFNQMMASQREGYDFTSEANDIWKNFVNEEDAAEHAITFTEDGLPILGEYVFEQNNPFLNTSNALERAKAVLAAKGSLTEAALLLEAAIQKQDMGIGGYEAWILLGETWSMDEREQPAMKALENGVKIASQHGDNGIGMVSLAISYTNESYEKASYTMLLRWLRAKYSSFAPPETSPESSVSSWVLRDQATDGFLAIARQQHASGAVDPDVQIGLGVLLYTAGDFERAKDCFQSALLMRPDDYLLWNRYGSCLSNDNKPEEALGAYREALNIRPTYTRAIYNVGVACLNIGAHKEAAEHLLSGLALQSVGGGSTSEQLWTTLRRCFTTMDRGDLAGKSQPGADLNIFRREGFEF